MRINTLEQWTAAAKRYRNDLMYNSPVFTTHISPRIGDWVMETSRLWRGGEVVVGELVAIEDSSEMHDPVHVICLWDGTEERWSNSTWFVLSDELVDVYERVMIANNASQNTQLLDKCITPYIMVHKSQLYLLGG